MLAPSASRPESTEDLDDSQNLYANLLPMCEFRSLNRQFLESMEYEFSYHIYKLGFMLK